MITVNGRQVDHRADETVSRLLGRLKYVFPLVIVKLDGTVIPRGDFVHRTIEDGMNVEVIHLTSGG